MTDTSTEIAIRPEPAALARPNLDREITDSWVDVIRPITILAQQIAETSFVPKGLRGDAPATAAAILHGRELGLPPMTSLAGIHMIEGKPSVAAEILRSLVLAAGHEIEVEETTSARCVLRGRRRGTERWTRVEWTIDQARAAGLTSKDNWRKHPRTMLQARASSELCRLVFPDVCHGMGAAEELQDDADTGDSAPAAEQPKTTVSRARRSTTPAPKAPARSGETGAPSTPTTPLEVEIPMPDAPAPSGPAGNVGPGPEDGQHATPTDQQVVDQAAAEAPERDQPADVVPYGAPRVTQAQLRMLGVTWSKLGVGDDDRRNYTEALIGRTLEGGTTKDLTKREATKLIDQVANVTNLDQLDDLITEALQAQGAQ